MQPRPWVLEMPTGDQIFDLLTAQFSKSKKPPHAVAFWYGQQTLETIYSNFSLLDQVLNHLVLRACQSGQQVHAL